ncbi:extracellular solute-binding protein [Microlunatus parietis]
MPPTDPTQRLDRRTLLSGAAAVTGGLALTTALPGCTTPEQRESVAAGAAVDLPTYRATAGAEPQFPSTGPDVMPGFTEYPRESVAPATDGTPPIKSGKPLTILTNVNTTIPPALGQNAFWRGMNERVGAELTYIMAPNADYLPKLQVSIAGGDLPDIVQFRGIPNLPQLLERSFVDLSEYVSGDNIARYPNLAAIPTASWRSMIYNRRIYGFPLNRSTLGDIVTARIDLIEERGANPDPQSYQEFLDAARVLTEPKRNRWAMCNPIALINWTLQMLDAPNGWAEEGGRFTHQLEDEKYKQALDAAAQQWKEGLFHPDSFSVGTRTTEWYNGGIIGISTGGASPATWDAGAPGTRSGALVPPKFDGGGYAVKFLGSGIYGGPVCIRKAEKARVDEIVELFNYLASPFGSTEHQYIAYGSEGTDFTYQGNNPVPTDQALLERNLPITYTGAPAQVNFSAVSPGAVENDYAYQKKCAEITKANASSGLYSATEQEKGNSLRTRLDDLATEIILGRKPVTDWDAAMDTWRREGGDQIRAEYEAAIEAN